MVFWGRTDSYMAMGMWLCLKVVSLLCTHRFSSARKCSYIVQCLVDSYVVLRFVDDHVTGVWYNATVLLLLWIYFLCLYSTGDGSRRQEGYPIFCRLWAHCGKDLTGPAGWKSSASEFSEWLLLSLYQEGAVQWSVFLVFIFDTVICLLKLWPSSTE